MLPVFGVGTTIGRYELFDSIGFSDLGQVYKAKSFGVEGFEKTLAIKLISADLAANETFVNRFVENTKRAVRLQHANIVQVFDIGTAPQVDATQASPTSADNIGSAPTQEVTPPPSPFIAMEFVEGCNLTRLLDDVRKTGFSLPIGLCLYIGCQVAKALDHAHRRCDERMVPLGIVHGGICPNNVLISWEGQVKVSDFCMPQWIELSHADDSQLVLKHRHVDYLSPEQATQASGTCETSIDGRSDLFSLALVLYEMLTGVNPLRCATHEQTLQQVQSPSISPIGLYRPDVPKSVETLIEQTLATNPDSRIQTAQELFEQLQTVSFAHGFAATANDLADYVEKFWDDESYRQNRAPWEVQNPGIEPKHPFASPQPASGASQAPAHFPHGPAAVSWLPPSLPPPSALPWQSLANGKAGVSLDAGFDDVADETDLDWSAPPPYAAVVPPQVPPPNAQIKCRQGKFVGRNNELRRFGQVLDAAMASGVQLVTVTGCEGIGKTRFIMEIDKRLRAGNFDVSVYVATCSPSQRDESLSALALMLVRLCAASAKKAVDCASTVHSQLMEFGLSSEQIDAVMSEFVATRPRAQTRVHAAGLLRHAFYRIVHGLCQQQLHVFAWDNAHAMDDATLDVLNWTSNYLAKGRAVWLLAGQSPLHHTLLDRVPHESMSLEPLSDSHTAKLLANITGLNKVPENIVQLCHRQCEGIPARIETFASQLEMPAPLSDK